VSSATTSSTASLTATSSAATASTGSTVAPNNVVVSAANASERYLRTFDVRSFVQDAQGQGLVFSLMPGVEQSRAMGANFKIDDYEGWLIAVDTPVSARWRAISLAGFHCGVAV
jgi:hypothetical protein